jgi:hypothetical protein
VAQSANATAHSGRIVWVNPVGGKFSVCDDGAKLGVHPVGYGLEASRLVDTRRLAAHEDHHREIRWNGFGDYRGEASLKRPVKEVVKQVEAKTASLITGVAGIGVVELPDVVTEHGERARRQVRSMAGEVGPVQWVP